MKKGFPVYDICTLSEQQQHDLQIDRFGHYLDQHKNLHFPHKHNFYHLVLFTEGKGSHAIDFKRFEIQTGQIYFMIPGQVHSWDFEDAMDGYIINFSPAFFNSYLLRADYPETLPFFSGNIDDAVINLTEAELAAVRAIMEAIVKENDKPDNLSLDMVRVLMVQLFTQLTRLHTGTAKATAPSYNQTLLKNFQRLIEQNFSKLKLPKDYAELLYITPNHLNALCNDILGMSAGEVIRNRVVLEAKRLLINQNLTIADIAGQLNFTDNSYFTRFFRKQVSLTPDEFRKNNLIYK
ncbi:helix-turn-helix transcriptional regulator [Mucilaginibacter gynuensis]|uniref:Helix-turn-helix transcriptional regulator n=1 Tax=Mucilaginibacter gynuensis TaxID=1302236 RepID=A0ABP8HG23_9SPHI